jgi:hypothetical protein
MNCIAFAEGSVLKISTAAPRRATDPEIAILQLSEQEYAALHKNPKDFVNNNHVFEQPVREMVMQSPAPNAMRVTAPAAVDSAATGTTWLVLVRHRPDSSAVGAAVAA